MYPVGYPAIGLAGSTIVIAFQAFKAETSQAGFNYADIFLVQSTNGGSTWTAPQNLTQSTALDERYASMSKWNPGRSANMVFQEDPQPGSSAFGNDGSPLARSRQRFMRIGDPTAVGSVVETPREFRLYQNYPNPFNPSTTFKFQIPDGSGHRPNTNHVTLKVFDMLGREVATVVNEEMGPGNYEKVFDGTNLASGVYLYRLNAGDFSQTKKLLLIR
ncbi:MAG: T9SS type A sorting domain-containing protein [Ignavibacteriae bacterium]|nr:T9SS type A sorting domain-containing protein [Ignavibacteriota bacterium]